MDDRQFFQERADLYFRLAGTMGDGDLADAVRAVAGDLAGAADRLSPASRPSRGSDGLREQAGRSADHLPL